MLTNYTPTMPAPSDSSEPYANGWLYANCYLSVGGSADADSSGGWHD